MASYATTLATVVAVLVVAAAAAAFVAAGGLLVASARRRRRLERAVEAARELRATLIASPLDVRAPGPGTAESAESAAGGERAAQREPDPRWALRRQRSAEWEGLFTLRTAANGNDPVSVLRGSWLTRLGRSVPVEPHRLLACLDDLEDLPAELLTWAPRHAPEHVVGNLREALTLLDVDRDVRAALAEDPLGGLSSRDIRLENVRGQAPGRGGHPGAAP